MVAEEAEPKILEQVATVGWREGGALCRARDVVAMAERKREVGRRDDVVRVQEVLRKVCVAAKESRARGAPPVVPRRADLVGARAEAASTRC